jgi:CSLREA domain-containing protein
MVLTLAVGLFAASSARAQTCTVTDNSDSTTDTGSLRYCVNNATSGETISFSGALNGQTITLISTNGPLGIGTNLTIQGPGANLLTISGANAVGVFQINSGTVSISGLTIANGSSQGSGAIYNLGTLTLNNSTVSGNSVIGDGGGIYSDGGTVTLNNSTVSGNSATGDGGGIFSYGGKLTVSNSTVSGNSAARLGGGIFTINSTATVSNNTLSGNIANSGGGIFLVGQLTVTQSTFSGNSATTGGGIATSLGSVVVSNSIMLAGDTCSGTGCPTNGTSGNVVGVSTANLLPLGNYGGPTQTMLPLPGSPAICAGSIALVPAGVTTDQRGFPPIASCVDAGAVQTNYLTVTTLADATDGSPDCYYGTGSAACSLRDAMNAGNTAGKADIAFAASLNGGTITLASALPAITGQMNLIGPGANNLTVSGNDSTSVGSIFTVNSSAEAFLYGLTIANAHALGNGGGTNNSGALTVSNSTFSPAIEQVPTAAAYTTALR